MLINHLFLGIIPNQNLSLCAWRAGEQRGQSPTLFVPHPSNRGGLSGEAQFAYGGDERGIWQEPGGLSEKPREQRRFGGREVRDEDDGDSGTRGGDDDGLLVRGLFSFFVVTNPLRVLIRRTENFLLQKDIHRRSDQNPNGVKRCLRSLCE